MLFLIWGLLIVIGILFPKSKIVSVMMVGFMIIAIGFRTQGADYNVYHNEFKWAEYQVFSDVHYAGYLVLEQYAYKFGIQFSQFLLIIGSVSCLLLYIGIKRLTPYVNTVLSLFFIYPFSHEAVQTRTFLANSVLVAALPLILKEPEELNDKKIKLLMLKTIRIVLFYLIAAVACTFHFEAIFYVFILTLMLYLPSKYGKFYIIVGVISAFFLIETGLLAKILQPFNSRIAFWLSGNTGIGILIPIFVTLLIWYAMQFTGKLCVYKCKINSSEQIFYRKLLRISDFIILLIPLFCYDITFNRLWRLFLIILYIMIAKTFKYRISQNTRLLIIFLGFSIFIFILTYEKVFVILYGLFENNSIFGNMSVF